MMRREDVDPPEPSPSRVTSTYAQITEDDEEKGYRGRIYSQTGQYGAPDVHFEFEDVERDVVWEALCRAISDSDKQVIWI